jgi:hypothetical protein
LQTKLQEFVALASSVGHWSIELGNSVGYADDTGWLKCAAGEWSLESSFRGVRVDSVDIWGVAGDTEGGVVAVRAIERIEESIETTVLKGLNIIIDLVKSDGLWLSANNQHQDSSHGNQHTTYVNQRKSDVNIEIRLSSVELA